MRHDSSRRKWWRELGDESARVCIYHRGEWVGAVTSTDRALSNPQRLDQVY
jgi:hypothetical protein